MPASDGPRRHIRIYTRQGCHLCDDAIAVVTSVARAQEEVEIIDIDTHPGVAVDDYTIRVPVIEVDGVEIAQYQVDHGTLLRALGR